MDHEGYGRSDRTASWSDVASGVDDLKAAMGVVEKITGRSRAAFFGQSSGACAPRGLPTFTRRRSSDSHSTPSSGPDRARRR